MKIIIFLILTVLLVGCSTRFEYTLAVGEYLPDSNKIKVAEFVKQTVEANNRYTSGEYEEIENVIKQAEFTGQRIFSIQTEGLTIQQVNAGNYYNSVFVPVSKFTDRQKEIFEHLKSTKEVRYKLYE